MEYKMVTIPFDLETAKKINIGERVGQIVTEKGRNRAEIVYEDNSSICPLLDLDAGDATWLHQSCCCDHCVNHLGIDLCDCGSEHKVGECECGSQKAHDTLGIKYDSFEAILKNFG